MGIVGENKTARGPLLSSNSFNRMESLAFTLPSWMTIAAVRLFS